MTVATPPRPPQFDDLDALIREARERQRRRRFWIAAAAIVLLGAAGLAYGIGRGFGGGHSAIGGSDGKVRAGQRGASQVALRRCPAIPLGTVAFIRGGALDAFDFRTCRLRVLVPEHAAGSVKLSADGRYVAFSRGYVSVRGGAVHRTPPGAAAWAPRSDLLAVATVKGGLVLIDPRGKTRELLPDGWSAGNPVFSPDGRTLAVTRLSHERPIPKPIPGRQQTPSGVEIWLVDVASGRTRMILPREVSMQPLLVGFSPSGRWLLYQEYPDAASLAADGMTLAALRVSGGRPVEIARVLGPDLFTWCANRLVYVIDHGGRMVTLGDGVAVASPPSWRSRTILPAGGKTSWSSVACPTAAAAAKGGGGLVVAGGPASADSPFGREHRSLWMVAPTPGAKPQQLSQTIPPKGETDELPMWSGDGRWILFVRTKPGGIRGRGALYALDPFGGNLVGPFTGIGNTDNYYGSYGWSSQLDWHRSP